MTKEESILSILKKEGDCIEVSCDNCVFKTCNKRKPKSNISEKTTCYLNIYVCNYDSKCTKALQLINAYKIQLLIEMSEK